MQNSSVIDITKYNLLFNSRKAVKITAIERFKNNTSKMMDVLSKPQNTFEEAAPKEDISNKNIEISTQDSTNIVGDVQKNEDVKVDLKEVYQERLNNKNVVCYKNFSNSCNLVGSRRLRVNPIVPEKASEATNIVGIEMQLPVNETTKKEESTFDFSQFSKPSHQSIEKTASIEDYWNKKPTSNINTSIDTNVNDLDSSVIEISELQNKNSRLRESIETQKELLDKLLQEQETIKIKQEEKKNKLQEEQMELTQELNDLLAKINQLSDVVNKGRETLENESFGKHL